MTELEEVLKHAQLAHFDNELTSFAIVMIAKGDPEIHIAVSTPDVYKMNAGMDMLKLEIMKVMAAQGVFKEPRG